LWMNSEWQAILSWKSSQILYFVWIRSCIACEKINWL
jgi:hypothetical protein